MSRARGDSTDEGHGFSLKRMMTSAASLGNSLTESVSGLGSKFVDLVGLGDEDDAKSKRAQPLSPASALRRQASLEQQEARLAALDEGYFREDFDPVLAALNSVPVVMDAEFLPTKLEEIESVAALLDSKLHTAIQENSASFVQGMQHIQDVELDLTMTNVLCKNGRRMLKSFDQDLVHSIFHIVSRVKRRKHYMEVIAMLNEIHSILRIEQDIKDLLQKGDFTQAMELHIKGLSILPALEKFVCMSDVRVRFGNGQLEIRQQMIDESKNVAREFAIRRFQNVAKVFVLLQDPQQLSNLFQKSYLEVVDETTNSTIAKFVAPNMPLEQASKIAGRDLIGMLDAEKFLPCFMDVVQALAAVLFSYHKVCEYLNSIAPDAGTALPTAAATVDSAFELTPAVVSMMREAKAIFASFRRSVWERVQQRITSLLACAGASRLSNTQLKMQELLHVLNASSTFIAIGECFSGSDSKALNESIYKKSKEYFDNIHRESYAVLRQNMEMDSFDALPVPDDFSTRHVKEFRQPRALMQARAAAAAQSARFSASASATDAAAATAAASPSSGMSPADRAAIFARFVAGERLFSAVHAASGAALVAADQQNGAQQADDAAAAEELRAAEEDIDRRAAARGQNRRNAPIVTLSSNMVLKCIGKYLSLMESLAPVAADAFDGVAELFDFYLYAVFTLFSVNTQRLLTLNPASVVGGVSGVGAPTLFAAGAAASSASSSSSSKDKDEWSMSALSDRMSSFADQVGAKLDALKNVGDERGGGGGAGGAGDRDERDALEWEALGELKATLIAIKDGIDRGTFAGGLFTSPAARASQERSAQMGGLKPLGAVAPSQQPLVMLSDAVDLQSAASYRGLRARCLAVESLDFVLAVLKECEPRFRAALPRTPHAQAKVGALLVRAENAVADFRAFFYKTAAALPVGDTQSIAAEIARSVWELDDIDSSASAYVDTLAGRLRAYEKAVQSGALGGPLPAHIGAQLWKEIVQRVQEVLVDAYARVPACNTEGRAQMSMDATTLKKEIDSIAKLKVSFALVNDYVGAFYLRQDEFLKWMVDHTQFKLAHYKAVAEIGALKQADRGVKKTVLASIVSQYERNVAAERRKLGEMFAARRAAGAAATAAQ